MNERTLQQLNRVSLNNGSISDEHSAAIALAICRYIDLNEVPDTQVELRKAIVPLLDELVNSIPLNFSTITLYAYQLHQYRHSTDRGYFPNAKGASAPGDMSWLFGMNQFMSSGLMESLSSPTFIAVYRTYCSIFSDIAETGDLNAHTS